MFFIHYEKYYIKQCFVSRLEPPVTSPLTSPVVTMETKKVSKHHSEVLSITWVLTVPGFIGYTHTLCDRYL